MPNPTHPSLRPAKILYAAGPGNIIGTYRHWLNKQDDPAQVSVTYSGQFYDLCAALGWQAYVISSYREREQLKDGQFWLEHRPKATGFRLGTLYHLYEIWYGLRLTLSALRFRADFVVVDSGTTHWFVLSLMSYFGIKVIPSLHCVLWRKYLPQKRTETLFLKLGRRLFQRDCYAMMTVSEDIEKQVAELTGGKTQPIVPFLPLYRRVQFEAIQSANPDTLPFRIVFAGRIETDKGVFDLLEIAKRLILAKDQDIVFDICGSGSALELLRSTAQQAGLSDRFVCHGHCNKSQMQRIFEQSHAVIVPTRKDFVEGFNQVVAEAILAGRPVITSTVCPAIAYVAAGVVEVLPEDIDGYADAILKLCQDRSFYEEKRQSCGQLSQQFYEPNNSWGAALRSILKSELT